MRRALLFLFLAACSKDTARPPPAESATPEPLPAPPPSAPTAPPARPEPRATVTLVDAGQKPLRVLRYAFHADRAAAMSVDLTTAVSAQGPGGKQDIPLPPLHLVIALDPRSVTPDGELRFAWHIASAHAAPSDAASPPGVAEGWIAELQPVQGLSGTGAVTTRGLTHDVVVDRGDAAPPAREPEMVTQVVQMVRDYVAAPLPEEPVGKGARWQKIASLAGTTGQASQTDTFTLTDLAGDLGVLDDVVAQTASPQALPVPGASPGAPGARLDSLLTSASSKVRFDLGRLVPQVTLDGTTQMAVSSPGSPVQMVMRVGITVRGTSP